MKQPSEFSYTLRETLRQMGFFPFIKGGLLLSLVLWFFWPEPAQQPPQTTTSSNTPVVSTELMPPPAEPTDHDLRTTMTAEQTAFYWESFVWMMQQGKELKPTSLDGRTMFVTYVKDIALKTPGGLTCHPFSEKIIVAGKFNRRRGIGCQNPSGTWCRQMEDEKAECRGIQAAPGVFDDLSTEMDNSLHNLRIDWNRNLGRLGF